MRAAGLVLFLLGFVFGTFVTLSVAPNTSLTDFFGHSPFVAALGSQAKALTGAVQGVAVGVVWALFGLSVALIWMAIGSLFRGLGRSR